MEHTDAGRGEGKGEGKEENGAIKIITSIE
jgi:hypothetical protein